MIDRIRGNMKTTDFYPTPEHCILKAKDYIKESKNIIDVSAGLGYPLYYMSKINSKAKYTGIEYNDFTHEVSQNIFKDSNIDIKRGDFFKLKLNSPYDYYFLNPPFTSSFSKKDNYFIKFILYLIMILNTTEVKKITSQILMPSKFIDKSGFKIGENVNLADVILKTPKKELERYFKELDFFNKLDVDLKDFIKEYKKDLEKGTKYDINDVYYIILEDFTSGLVDYMDRCKFDTTNFKISNLIWEYQKQ